MKEFFQIAWTKIKGVLTSRKFWTFVGAVAAVGAAFFGGEITAWEAVQAIVAAAGIYMSTVAYEDVGRAKAEALIK